MTRTRLNKEILVSVLLAISSRSFAQSEFSPDFSSMVWSCELQTTKLSGFSIGIGGAFSYVHGNGNVRCSVEGNSKESNTPVNVQLSGIGLGIGYVDIKELNVQAFSTNLASPIDLLGKLKLGGNVSFARLQFGSRSGKFTTSNNRGDSVNLDFTGYVGLGAEASMEVQSISIDLIK